ncbi:MAG: class I SAM-dependent methyltransferase [Pseudomonadota bacterium]
MTPTPGAPCPLCDSDDWRPLSDIQPDRSVRTDGGVVAAPISKAHCAGCGLAQRHGHEDDTAALYAEDYQLYANRPNADLFDLTRHGVLVETVKGAWGNGAPPARVLEVGCGDGGLLAALSSHWTASEMIGVEPASSAVRVAQAAGRPVVQGMIGVEVPSSVAAGGFDLIYSIHVVEHTPDPSDFLRALGALLAPGGRLVITCPDGAVPHAEIIHPDHLWSMTREHLAAFARRGGLGVQAQGDCPSGASAEFSQMLVCAPDAVAWAPLCRDPSAAEALHAGRQAYLTAWRGLEAALLSAVRPDEPLYAFGAGGWAANIAGNCPGLWARVEACVIDGGAETRMLGKAVLDYATLKSEPRQFVGLVNPAVQGRIAARLSADGHAVAAWPPGIDA